MAKIKLVDDILEGRHRKLSTRDLRENLAEALTFTSRDRKKLILTKNGEDRAALVSIEDVWLLDALEELDIREALRGGLDKKVLWSVLRERLQNTVDGIVEGAEQNRNGRGRIKAGTKA